MTGAVFGNMTTDNTVILTYATFPAAGNVQADSKAMLATAGPGGLGYNLVDLFSPGPGVIWARYQSIASGS